MNKIKLYFCPPKSIFGCVAQLNRASRQTAGKVLGKNADARRIEYGCVAQLNRASRQTVGKVLGKNADARRIEYGCVAQLNRASDYGSEGFRFES